jgi:ABC-2 type transport system permease protein
MRIDESFEQMKRSITIAKKDVLIYYLKGPVIIFGILIPLFLFLAFYIGRDLQRSFLISGLISMTLFFTTTAIGPVAAPWETMMKTLERLASSPIYISTILVGDILASLVFGIVISSVPLMIGISIGVSITHPFIFVLSLVLAAFCFSAMGLLFSATPTSTPSTVMMLSALVKFPLIFISGIFIPVEELPAWGRIIASASPLTYFTDLMRYSLGGSGYYPLSLSLIILLLFTIGFIIIAIKLHEKSLPKRL